MSDAKKLLIVEKSLTLGRCYQAYLSEDDYQVIIVRSGTEAIKFIDTERPHVVLLELELDDMKGNEVILHSQEKGLGCVFVVMTAQGSAVSAVDAMNDGALDYLEKPFTKDRLCITLKNAMDRYQWNLNEGGRAAADDRRGGEEVNHYYGFIGTSEKMQQVYRVIGAAAESKATVFITGESGTGKEVCALAIHEKSQRRDNEFVAINCAAIPRDLMESEIFGHVKGAFTGAHAAREGAASLASGGTLFLDELGEMDIDLQSKLLRFVQTGTFKKVGGSKLESVDVRFVCATNRDPLAQVARGEFREDLYYRLHVIPIELPPLRDRGSDALDIARNFLKCFAEEEEKSFVDFSLKTEAILSNYNWPGNIRQLQNVIRNVVVLNEGEQVLPEMLPPPLNGTMQTPTFVDDADDEFAITRFDLEQEKAIAAAAASTANDLHAQISSQTSNLIAAHASNPTVDQVLSQVPSETYIPPAALEIIQKLIVEKNQAMGEEHKIKALWAVEMEAIEEAIRICGDSIPKAAKYLEVSPSTIYRKRQAWKNIGYLQD